MLQLFLRRAFVVTATYLALVSDLSAQTATPTATKAPAEVLQAFGLTVATTQDLALPQSSSKPFQVVVQLAGARRVLDLRPHDVRAGNFRLLVDDGRSIRQLPTPPSVTFQGGVVSAPGSRVAASLIKGQVSATIHLGTELWVVQPVSTQLSKYAARTHVVFRSKDVAAMPKTRCGVLDFAKSSSGQIGGTQAPMAAVVGHHDAELAVDADYDYYRRYGSNVTRTQNQVVTVINGVNVIYKRDTQIDHRITTILVRTSRVYPNITSMSTILDNFRSRWRSTHTGISRDVAHMFTGKGGFSGIVGVAHGSAICSRSFGYGVSKAFSNSLSTNVGLVAHELGHNWGASHCDSSNPCYVMCSFLGRCNRSLSRFGSSSIGRIVSFRRGRNCLSQFNTPFGFACRGAGGTPDLDYTETPRLGATINMRMTNGKANSNLLYVIGGSRTIWKQSTLPLHLQQFGAFGCFLNVSLDSLIPLRTDNGGNATLPIKIPNNSQLVGARAYHQFFVVDTGANNFGMVGSNGVETWVSY